MSEQNLQPVGCWNWMAGNSAADSKPHSHLYPFQSFIFRFHFSALQLKKKMALWKPDFGIDKDRW